MGVLTPVVEIAALPMFHPRQDRALRRTVALQFIRDDPAWHIGEALEQLPKDALIGFQGRGI
jgi:hypothetical protein